MYRRSMSAFQFVLLLPPYQPKASYEKSSTSKPFFFFSAMAWSADSFAVEFSAARGAVPMRRSDPLFGQQSPSHVSTHHTATVPRSLLHMLCPSVHRSLNDGPIYGSMSRRFDGF